MLKITATNFTAGQRIFEDASGGFERLSDKNDSGQRFCRL
jgi:hypothetical protein